MCPLGLEPETKELSVLIVNCLVHLHVVRFKVIFSVACVFLFTGESLSYDALGMYPMIHWDRDPSFLAGRWPSPSGGKDQAGRRPTPFSQTHPTPDSLSLTSAPRTPLPPSPSSDSANIGKSSQLGKHGFGSLHNLTSTCYLNEDIVLRR